MLRAPTEVVIATADLDAALRHLAVVDLHERSRHDLPGAVAHALYGIEAPVTEVVLAPDGDPAVARGLVRLVTGATPSRTSHPHRLGPMAVDVYTADIDLTVGRALASGVATGHVGTLQVGPLVMRQCQVVAPDGWRLVVVEANHRRSSLLDTDAGRLHSEVHSLLWTVSSLEEATTPFTGSGLDQAHVFPFDDPELARILGIARDEAALRMNLLVDGEGAPIRLELVEFTAPTAAAGAPVRPPGLGSGVHGPLFDVDDLEVAAERVGGAQPATVVELDGQRRTVIATGAGVRLHLRSAS